MKNLSYKQGTVIFKEKDAGNVMYSIKSGKVGIYISYNQDGEKLLVELEAGKYFGEMAVIDNMPRSATAVALTDVDLLEISGDIFDEFISQNPGFGIEIIQNLSQRIRSLTGDYMEACKTLAEFASDESNKSKKEGLWAKIKKFADFYYANENIDYYNIYTGYTLMNNMSAIYQDRSYYDAPSSYDE